MKAYFDTNVLVAALKAEHLHHARSLAAVLRVHRGAGTQGVLEGEPDRELLTEDHAVDRTREQALIVTVRAAREVRLGVQQDERLSRDPLCRNQ